MGFLITDSESSAKSPHPDGLSDALQQHPEIWDELRHLCPDFYGATYEKMGELGYVMWPCRVEIRRRSRGASYLFKEVRYPERTGSSSPPTGSRRSTRNTVSTRWYCRRCAGQPLLVPFNDR